MPASRLSLAEQIAQLDAPAPVDFDLENLGAHGSENETDELVSRDHYADVGPSSLRKMQDPVLSDKYSSVKVSRARIEADGEDHEASEAEEDEDREEDTGDEVDQGYQEEDGPDQSSEVSGEDDAVAPQVKNTTQPREDDMSTSLRQKREEDQRKGKAISRQLGVWDSLLDSRIRVQKAVAGANRLPTVMSLYAESESMKNMLEETVLLSEELFQLRENLLRANGPVEPSPRKRRKLGADTSLAEHLQAASREEVAFEELYHPHLVQTLSKWSSKIQAVAPSALLPSTRNAFSKSHQNNLKNAVQLIEESSADHSKLLARTQVWRQKGRKLDDDPSTEDTPQLGEKRDAGIFDDTDFYQQLLRDVIDSQGGKGNDDWITAQKQQKAKKKVDTRASKGRKIRYEVHEKLQSFMVPITQTHGTWHEEQIDELFGSLLGKGFENALGDELEGPTEGTGEHSTGELHGFRVF